MTPSPQARSNSFIGTSALIFLSKIFPAVANAFVIIYFSHKLDTSVYGTYINFWVRLNFIGAFAGLGLQSFLLTYNSQVVAALLKKIKQRQYAYLLLWICICAVSFAYIENIPIGGRILPFSFFVVYTLMLITESVLLVFKHLRVLIWVNIGYAFVFSWLHYSYTTESFTLTQLFIYLLLLATVKLLICLAACYAYINKQSTTHAPIPALKSIIGLWRHMGIYEVIQIVFSWIDKFIIAWILSESISAIYNNGARDVPFLPVLMSAVSSAALMQLSVDNSTEAPVTIMNKTARILSSVIFPIFFFLVFFRYEIYGLVFSDKYLQSVPIFLLAIMVLPLRAYNFIIILQNQHKGAIINKGAVYDLLIACLLMYPLYKWLGLPGVALSFVISTYLQSAYYIYHSAKVLNTSWLKLIPLSNWLIKLIVFASLFISIHYALQQAFTPQIVLTWGLILAAIITVVSIIIEVKTIKRKYGNTTATQVAQI